MTQIRHQKESFIIAGIDTNANSNSPNQRVRCRDANYP